MDTFSAAERLERLPLTSYQTKVFFVIASALLFDWTDVAMMTYALGPIKTDFCLNTTAAGLLGSMTFVGMFIGASCAGLLADRFGRVRILQWSMIGWGIASILCAFAPNINILMGFRVLLGIAMAMEPVAVFALLSEITPTKHRGQALTYLEGMAPLGFIAAGLMSYILLPIAGWRSLFIVEAIPALFVFFIRRNLMESPRWLEDKGKTQLANEAMEKIENGVLKALGKPLPEPKKLPINHVVGSPPATLQQLFRPGLSRRTIMIWSVWFFTLLGYFGLTTWLGALLTAKGFAIAKSSLFIVFISFAGIPGFLVLSKLVESWGRKPCMIATLLGSAISAYFYGTANSFTQVAIYGFIMQFFMYGMWCTLYAYTPDLYPTNLRATGAGFASASGRLGALLGPYIVGALLPICGQTGVFELGGGAFIAAAVLTLVLGEETKGKILEEISPLSAVT